MSKLLFILAFLVSGLASAQSLNDCHLTVISAVPGAGFIKVAVEVRDTSAGPILGVENVIVNSSLSLAQMRTEAGGTACYRFRIKQASEAEAATKASQISGWSGTVQAVQP